MGGRTLPAALRGENITLRSSLGMPLMIVGVLLVAVGVGGAMAKVGGAVAHQGLAAFHIGAMAVLAICLSSTILLMIWNLLNSGWSATIRRQFENVATFLPFAFALAYATPLIDYINGGQLFAWMNPHNYGDSLLQTKWTFFFGHPFGEADAAALKTGTKVFPLFFIVRAVAYLVLWTYVSRRLFSLSVEQDRTGDPMLSAKARFTSAWGILLMSLSTAFAGFDLLMSLDYRFFSTMWGVYFCAGGMFGATYMMAFILTRLRAKGKLQGAVTDEHFHDLGKLMFAFTVFWGYIAFSQYFLIWYSNIPEETSYYVFRKQGVWFGFTILLCFGHFLFPFLFILSRHVKKNMTLMALIGLWAMLMHGTDIYWLVRPLVFDHDGHPIPLTATTFILDFAAILGVALVFGGYIVKKMTSGPLVAVNDPWMAESLHHKNYV
jgi:hypothetical protein